MYDNGRKILDGTHSGVLNVFNAVSILTLFMFALVVLIGCSGTPDAAEIVTVAPNGTTSAPPTIMVTEATTATKMATATPVATLTQTPTAEPTTTQTPTPTPLPTSSPTPSPSVEYLILVEKFFQGTAALQPAFLRREVTDEELETLEQQLIEVQMTGQAISEFDNLLTESLELFHPDIVEAIEVCMVANEGVLVVARNNNAGGRMVDVENLFEIAAALTACQEEMLPRLVEALEQ